MAIDFDNPLTAGTVLVRSAIQSQNYIQGSTGWKVAQDGSAEFNNVTVRGTVTGSTINGGTITGSTINGGTITGTTISGGTVTGTTINGGTINGSTIISGTAPNPQVKITTTSSAGEIVFPSNASYETSPSMISGQSSTGSGLSYLWLRGPSVTSDSRQMELRVLSAENGNTNTVPSLDIGIYGGSEVLQVDPDQFMVNSAQMFATNLTLQNAPGSTYAFGFEAPGGGVPYTFVMSQDGKMSWGNGSAAVDTNLYRSAANQLTTDDSLHVSGVLTAANRVVGTVTLAPTGTNQITSATVTFPQALTGTSFACQATANTSVPGTDLIDVSYSSVTSTSVIIRMYRQSQTNTVISYSVEGF